MNLVALSTLIGSITGLLTAATNGVSKVIDSQPPDVAKILWDRHVVLTQAPYDFLAKLLSLADPQIVALIAQLQQPQSNQGAQH